MNILVKLLVIPLFSFLILLSQPHQAKANFLGHDLTNVSCTSAEISFKYSIYTSEWIDPDSGWNVFGWYSDKDGSQANPILQPFTVSGFDGSGTASVNQSGYSHGETVTFTVDGVAWEDVNGVNGCVFSDPNNVCNAGPITRTCQFIDLSQVPCIPAAGICPQNQVCTCLTTAECCPGLTCDPVFGHCVAPPVVQNDLFCDNNGNPTTDPSSGKIYTAIGCIPVENFERFSVFILPVGLGVGGGIALLLIAIAGIMIKTSAGDPRKLQAGKELLFSAIAGLMLIVFSAYLLRTLGINILGIPEL